LPIPLQLNRLFKCFRKYGESVARKFNEATIRSKQIWKKETA